MLWLALFVNVNTFNTITRTLYSINIGRLQSGKSFQFQIDCIHSHIITYCLCLLWLHYTFYHTDIDECTEETDNCDDAAICTNTDGGFTCLCEPGFSGDGVQCEGKIIVILRYCRINQLVVLPVIVRFSWIYMHLFLQFISKKVFTVSLKIIFHHSPKQHSENVVPFISTHQILMNVKRTQMTVISTPHVTIMMEASAVSVWQVCQAMEPHVKVCTQFLKFNITSLGISLLALSYSLALCPKISR